MFRNVKELIQLTKEKNVSISEIMITQEIEVTGRTREDIFKQMEANLAVMEDAVQKGIEGVVSHSGLTGGDAVKLQAYLKSGKGLSGDVILDAVSKAVATNEVNAAMGTICATPTAGSAGVVPGTLFAVKRNFTRRKSRWSAFYLHRERSDSSLPTMRAFREPPEAVRLKSDRPRAWRLPPSSKWRAEPLNSAPKRWPSL